MASEIAWRKEAASSLMPALVAYRDETASTIGLRSQSRLPDEIVPRISSCKALPEISHFVSSEVSYIISM